MFSFSPIIIMFAITGFLLIVATSYAWSIFFNTSCVQELFHLPQIQGKHAGFKVAVLKEAFLVPLVCMDIAIIRYYSLFPNTDYFFTMKSPIILWNVVGFIISYAVLVFINRMDKTDILTSSIAYLLTLYICNLIVIVATTVAWLNTIPEPLQGSLLLLYTMLLLHFILVYIAMLMKRGWQVVLLLVYTVTIAQVNHTIRADNLRPNNGSFNADGFPPSRE
jgi:hypothetical protein